MTRRAYALALPVWLVAITASRCNAASEERSAPQPASAPARWARGLPSGPGFFPIAVWLQDPKIAPRYKEAGVNLYFGLWKGPTAEQLDGLRADAMPVICEQIDFALSRLDEPIIVCW
ncbi:MAG: hypothetical protein NTW86_31935, partial [Candidatus Sumerlaeota bacterium]|nr:hypothetical protein [Candidatus Sumerlaeota bacterium]